MLASIWCVLKEYSYEATTIDLKVKEGLLR